MPGSDTRLDLTRSQIMAFRRRVGAPGIPARVAVRWDEEKGRRVR
jgi:hypothetical protein